MASCFSCFWERGEGPIALVVAPTEATVPTEATSARNPVDFTYCAKCANTQGNQLIQLRNGMRVTIQRGCPCMHVSIIAMVLGTS